MTSKPARIGGSRFLYEPFDAASARIDANERINDERWNALERRLVRLEEVIDRIERRTVVGNVGCGRIPGRGYRDFVPENSS